MSPSSVFFKFAVYGMSARYLVCREVTAQLASPFVLSRRDYCNSVRGGLPRSTTEPLRQILNAAARLVVDFGPFDHVSPVLKQLHWLPIEHVIRYKLSPNALCARQKNSTVSDGYLCYSRAIQYKAWSSIRSYGGLCQTSYRDEV